MTGRRIKRGLLFSFRWDADFLYIGYGDAHYMNRGGISGCRVLAQVFNPLDAISIIWE